MIKSVLVKLLLLLASNVQHINNVFHSKSFQLWNHSIACLLQFGQLPFLTSQFSMHL